MPLSERRIATQIERAVAQGAAKNAQGSGAFADLIATLMRQSDVIMARGAESLNNIARTAVARVNEGTRPEIAAAALIAAVAAPPPETTAVLAVPGLFATGTFDIGPVRFIKANARSALHSELKRPKPITDLVDQMLGGVSWVGAFALTSARADAERVAEIARQRTFVCLTALQSACVESGWREVTLGFGSAFHGPSFSVGDTAVFFTTPPDIPQFELKYSPDDLARLRESPLSHAVALAASVPTEVRDDMTHRLLRAAALLVESLDGDPEDRLVRRWMAIEAMLSIEGTEITQTLAERVAVVARDAASDRADLKRVMVSSYGLRSAVAHGRTPRIEPKNLAEVGEAAFSAWRRLAHRRRDLDSAGTGRWGMWIDALKFAAEPYTSDRGLK
jgi:hypothetical protein